VILTQQATQGKLVNYTGLSYLGQALAVTFWVFPPVWTLPQTWPMNVICMAAKLDAMMVNGLLLDTQDNWNPDVENFRCHLASIGLEGKQHCPVGTAALFAVYQLTFEAGAY
jgi:hypothetical protein